MSDKKKGSDWPAIIFIFVVVPLAFTLGGIWFGVGALVIGVTALGWSKRHEGPFPTDRSDKNS